MDKKLNEEALQDLYAWIDKIPLSRPKRNISRDFSDGVMAAEVVKHFFPKLVDLHNYTAANSTRQKRSNWSTLNRKVFSQLNFCVTEEIVQKIVVSTAGCVEPVLCTLRAKIEERRLRRGTEGTQALEYYSTAHKEPQAEKQQLMPETSHQKPPRRKEDKVSRNDLAPVLSPTVDLYIRLLMEEKDQAMLALQQTVEILQIKVKRLEHLVQLKDMRITDLRRHLQHFIKP
ncbi:sperm flagellar protein 1 isoform X2 [Denticeps clupeoides]|uniref:Calponin-homology (CH) domain-containing protein n=1 Tax=Denticeps clupeoides TaxID=299321 RepID=A0AAY4B292_9TELE|nr:sperm flagellar protein 1 isoform X2 [Denticeps clupeoides]